MKRALIIGVSGQDGFYLAKYLHKLGYQVYGTCRRVTFQPSVACLAELGTKILFADMRDRVSMEAAFWEAWPEEVYNLAAQPFVPQSWTNPAETLDINSGGFLRLMEIVTRIKPDTRVYQASTSEMYGNTSGAKDEQSPFRPASPYAISKYAAHCACAMYRDLGLYTVSGILFNHESDRRAEQMVTQKIARAVAMWSLGSEDKLELGLLDARRDWGFSGDYVRAMHLMLQQDHPKDFVVGMGESHSILDFIRTCCFAIGLSNPPMHLVTRNEVFVRKNEIRNLYSDPKRALSELGWAPLVDFEGLCQLMVEAQIKKLQKMSLQTASLEH